MSFDLPKWLIEIGLPQYAELFLSQGFDGPGLASLTDADLRELGIAAMGHRKTILREAAKLALPRALVSEPDQVRSVAPLLPVQPVPRGRVFLSYGHDPACVEIVQRIRLDLQAAGWEPWVDDKGIRFGDDWRREITKGIQESQHVLAFLSQHSTRKPGVCRQEVAIALGPRKGHVYTVLVEPLERVSPPLIVSHMQWLDMQQWQELKVNDPAAYEALYRKSLAEILRVLERNEPFAGDIELLQRWLDPLDGTTDMLAAEEGFTGRRWLLDGLVEQPAWKSDDGSEVLSTQDGSVNPAFAGEADQVSPTAPVGEIERWRTSGSPNRVFWISAGPGWGKSAVAARLAHAARGRVMAVHYCRYNKPGTRDARKVVRTLAFQMATQLGDYRELLVRQAQQGTALAELNALELFDKLLANPLAHELGGGRGAHDRHLIVLDALDETLEDDQSELLNLVAGEFGKLPPWLGLVVTSRPEAPVLRQLGAFGVQHQSEDDQVLSQAFIKYRGMQEVLGYWLAWELAADGAIETALESAWRRWALPRDSYDCARVAGILERFMSYAGRPGKFALKVAKISANTFDKLPRCSNQAIEALINLAELYRVRSEHEAALKCAKRAIDSSTKKAVISGEIWRCWLHYGDILLAISRYDDAESAYSKALDCAALFKGNQSTEANFARLNRAWVSYTVGNYRKAVPEFQALFASLSINPGLRDPKTTQAANNLALLHFNLCKFDDAEKLARLSLDNDQVMFGSAHWMASMSALNLSWIEHAQGATDMANARCIGVVKNFDKTMGTTHPLWALAKSTQGWFLLVAGDIKGAEIRYEVAIEVLTKAVGEDHIDLLTPVDGLGWLYCRDSAYTKAAIYFERAYQLVLRNFGKEHPSICTPLCGLATTALAMGDNNLSQSLSKKALAIAERDFGLDHLDTAQAYTCLGATLNALGFFSEASENFEKAYRSRACILSASHPDVVSALKNFNLSKNLNHNQFNLFFTARRFSGSSVM